MLDTILVTKKIDNIIKQIWLSDIKQDYSQKSLLKEDSLKNAFYYWIGYT